MSDLEGILDRLLEAEFEFVLVGGFAAVVRFHGRELRILSLDALIRAKAALDRPRDEEAVIQLRALRERRREGS